MAIIDSIPGLSAWIEVEGKTAAEYNNPDDAEVQTMAMDDFDVPAEHNSPPPRVIKYIEATPGTRFSFHVHKDHRRFEQRSHHLAVRIDTDGRRVFVEQENEQGVGGPRDSHEFSWKWWLRKYRRYEAEPEESYRVLEFKFSPLEIVEADQVPPADMKKQLSLAQRTGVLTVTLFRMDETSLVDSWVRLVPPGSHDGIDRISEKALKGKAIDSRTVHAPLSDRQPGRPPPKVPALRYSDPRKRPFAVFEFRYRSKEGLIKEGIIPRPTVAEEVASMPEEERRRRLVELMEQDLLRTKREGGPHGGVKREAPSVDETVTGRYKTRRREDGALEFDLTDD